MVKQIEISHEIFFIRKAKQSKELLDRVKKAVEMAIEEGEEKSLNWLKSFE